MANVIFLLHGVGEHTQGWEQSVVAQMRAFCDSSSQRGEGDFDRRFKCVGINYSALFKDLLTEWATRRDNIDDLASQVGAELVERLLGWIAGSDEVEKDFLWTHAFDVVTYRLLPTVRDAVKVRVGLQLFEGIQGLDENANWSIIAHSFGTAVAHDTLHAWFEQPLPDGRGTLGQSRAPRLVQMVANVSRLLQTSPDAFDSTVRPGKACDFYHSAHHPFDPVTTIKPFLPANWPGPPSPEKYRLAVLEHDYIQQPNIHDLAQYLRHPDVVIPLFRCLAFDTYITKDKEAEYREKFQLHGDLTDPVLIDLRKRLEKAGVGLSDEWAALLVAWNRIREIRALLEGDNDD